MGRGKIGTPATLKMSPGKLRAVREAMRLEEARWRARCGPVTVRQVDAQGTEEEEPAARERP